MNAGSSSQVCILDEKKSQNFAIVIKSLTISQREILDVLYEGRGISAENLEKLARIAQVKRKYLKLSSIMKTLQGLLMQSASSTTFCKLFHRLLRGSMPCISDTITA